MPTHICQDDAFGSYIFKTVYFFIINTIIIIILYQCNFLQSQPNIPNRTWYMFCVSSPSLAIRLTDYAGNECFSYANNKNQHQHCIHVVVLVNLTGPFRAWHVPTWSMKLRSLPTDVSHGLILLSSRPVLQLPISRWQAICGKPICPALPSVRWVRVVSELLVVCSSRRSQLSWVEAPWLCCTLAEYFSWSWKRP